MRTMRQDAWTPEDDRVLADILLRHIRQGSTQLAAFEEAASILGRTAAACGYRWNAVVRVQHKESIQNAKAERKTATAKIRKQETPCDVRTEEGSVIAASDSPDYGMGSEIPAWVQILKLLRIYKKQHEQLVNSVKHFESVAKQKEEFALAMQEQIETLKSELNRVNEQYRTVKEEYYSLLTIVDRARRISEETVS